MLAFEIRQSIQKSSIGAIFWKFGTFMRILDPIIGPNCKKEHLKGLLYYLQSNTTL